MGKPNKQLSLFLEEEEPKETTIEGTEDKVEQPDPPKQKTAATMFQSFFLSGYVPMKQTEKKMDSIKDEMKSRLKDDSRKRIEYGHSNVIAKWRKMPIYETDYVGLNELLYDHGLLHIISIPTKGLDSEVKEELQPFLLPPELYVVPYTNNKKAKKAIEELEGNESFNVEDAAIEHMTGVFSQLYQQNKLLEDEYNILKAKMLKCPVLREEKKLTFDLGSIGLREKETGYDIDKIIEWFGIEYILEVGKPNMQELEYFIDNGMVNKDDVSSLRRLIDYRLDFLLMTKEAEEIQNQIFQDKLQRKIALSQQR